MGAWSLARVEGAAAAVPSAVEIRVSDDCTDSAASPAWNRASDAASSWARSDVHRNERPTVTATAVGRDQDGHQEQDADRRRRAGRVGRPPTGADSTSDWSPLPTPSGARAAPARSPSGVASARRGPR